jgi:23S rRNA pseudouridine1911/1915/1917 synthase
VHRLDKDTSGLMVVAKTLEAQTQLVRDLQARTVKRIYWAVALGVFTRAEGSIDAPIGRHPTQRVKMAVHDKDSSVSKSALTYWKVLKQYDRAAWLECRLATGRTHQIRVHLSIEARTSRRVCHRFNVRRCMLFVSAWCIRQPAKPWNGKRRHRRISPIS